MISAIVLAAGSSTRFGETKQILDLDGKPLVQHAIDASSGAGVDEIVVVLGHDARRVAAAVRLPANARLVVNDRYREGQSTSLAAGLATLSPRSGAVVVLLADQPEVRAEHIRALLDGWHEHRPHIARLRFRDAPGPALLARDVWVETARLSGDTGARELMHEHPDWVEEIAVNADAPRDVDTPEDWESLKRKQPH